MSPQPDGTSDRLPSFSVVIPTYDREATLPRAIRSVLAQQFIDYELIVVDDGSTDGTAEAVSNFSDPRVRYVRQENRGRSVRRTVVHDDDLEIRIVLAAERRHRLGDAPLLVPGRHDD